MKPIAIIGAGLAGSEAAWQLAQKGVQVVLYEMRPYVINDAHTSKECAELVCSNSFRSDDHEHNCVGLMHWEMRQLNSLIMQCADSSQVPAGGALAVDREVFAQKVTHALESHPMIEIRRELVEYFPLDQFEQIIVATGPLTHSAIAEKIADITGSAQLAFFDAIAPIVYADTIDMTKCWKQSRYDKLGPGGTGADYINCPLDKQQYEAFVAAINAGEKTEFKQWEGTPYFEGCLPIEVMASRGVETLRHGPLKPMGLTNAHNPTVKAYAVVQLRQDNLLGTLYNMVGFQTKLKYAEQSRIFRMITGLENAEFARLGGIHRNSYINSPKLLDGQLQLKAQPRIRFAGQITGCEGYVESAATGLMAGLFAADQLQGRVPSPPPLTTAMGALLNHITAGHIVGTDENTLRSFQPMNVNFGLFPPLPDASWKGGKRLKTAEKKKAKAKATTDKAKIDFVEWYKLNKVL